MFILYKQYIVCFYSLQCIKACIDTIHVTIKSNTLDDVLFVDLTETVI